MAKILPVSQPFYPPPSITLFVFLEKRTRYDGDMVFSLFTNDFARKQTLTTSILNAMFYSEYDQRTTTGK